MRSFAKYDPGSETWQFFDERGFYTFSYRLKDGEVGSSQIVRDTPEAL